jgi:hypothetical protein
MTNLILHYLHRDEGNWKNRFEVCIQNPADYTAEQAEQMIRECLIDGEFFYPEKVSLPFFAAADWYELDRVEADCKELVPLPTTFESLLDNLKESNKAHLQPIKVYKIPAGIPIRLAVSWLEFLHEMRQALGAITVLVRKDSVVIVFKNDNDWNLIEETLRLDSQSGNFDRDLRRDIERALDGVKEICNLRSSINLIHRKARNILKRVEKMIHRGM